jgi:hypothetical protein
MGGALATVAEDESIPPPATPGAPLLPDVATPAALATSPGTPGDAPPAEGGSDSTTIVLHPPPQQATPGGAETSLPGVAAAGTQVQGGSNDGTPGSGGSNLMAGRPSGVPRTRRRMSYIGSVAVLATQGGYVCALYLDSTLILP